MGTYDLYDKNYEKFIRTLDDVSNLKYLFDIKCAYIKTDQFNQSKILFFAQLYDIHLQFEKVFAFLTLQNTWTFE